MIQPNKELRERIKEKMKIMKQKKLEKRKQGEIVVQQGVTGERHRIQMEQIIRWVNIALNQTLEKKEEKQMSSAQTNQREMQSTKLQTTRGLQRLA